MVSYYVIDNDKGDKLLRVSTDDFGEKCFEPVESSEVEQTGDNYVRASLFLTYANCIDIVESTRLFVVKINGHPQIFNVNVSFHEPEDGSRYQFSSGGSMIPLNDDAVFFWELSMNVLLFLIYLFFLSCR